MRFEFDEKYFNNLIDVNHTSPFYLLLNIFHFTNHVLAEGKFRAESLQRWNKYKINCETQDFQGVRIS